MYQAGELEPERLGRAYVFLNKVTRPSSYDKQVTKTLHSQSHKAMPYINRPWRKRPYFLDYLSRYIDPPEDSPPQTNFGVDLAPFPSHILPSGRVVFPLTKRKDAMRIQGIEVKPDVVIFATGYRQEFPFLEEGYPTPDLADMRNVVKSGEETVAFIGFVRPGVGEKCSNESFDGPAYRRNFGQRRHTSHCRNAKPMVDIVTQESSSQTAATTPLSPSCQGDGSHQVWRRPLNLYEYSCEGYWCCSWSLGIVSRIRTPGARRLLVIIQTSVLGMNGIDQGSF